MRDTLWRLDPKELWRAFRQQPLSFQLVCVYLVFEYVRPQSLYPVIDILPWAQITILAAFAAVIMERGGLNMATPLSTLLLVFTAVVLMSAFAALRPDMSWAQMQLYISWVVIYFTIVGAVTTERRYFLFFVLFLLCSLKMSQHGARSWASSGFSFRYWGVTGAPGWFHNSGEFGIQMCVFLPLACYFVAAMRRHVKKWVFYALCMMPITAVMSMIATSSRGALVGGGLVGALMVLRSRHRVRGLAGLAAATVVVILLIPSESKDRFSTAGEDSTSQHRLVLWGYGVQIANDHPVLGVGYKNFQEAAWRYSNGSVEGTLMPHNIFIEAWAELGYTGLFVFLALIGFTFAVNSRTRRMVKPLGERGAFLRSTALGLDGALVGYMGSGFFVSVLYYPYFWINLAMTAALYVAAKDTVQRELRPRRQRRRSPAQNAPQPVGPPLVPRPPNVGAGPLPARARS